METKSCVPFAALRLGSELTAKTVRDIEALGLKVIKTKGDPKLPAKLQDAHYEIRPGAGMNRNQFKKAIQKLEPAG